MYTNGRIANGSWARESLKVTAEDYEIEDSSRVIRKRLGDNRLRLSRPQLEICLVHLKITQGFKCAVMPDRASTAVARQEVPLSDHDQV